MWGNCTLFCSILWGNFHCVASREETVHCLCSVLWGNYALFCSVLWGKDSSFVHFALTQQGCVHVKWWIFDILMFIRTWETVWLSWSLQCAYISIITNVHDVMLIISKVSVRGCWWLYNNIALLSAGRDTARSWHCDSCFFTRDKWI